MKRELWRLLALLFMIGLSATACTSENDEAIQELDNETTEIDSGATPFRLSDPIWERDLVQARLQLDAARGIWDNQAPFAYTLALGDQVQWELEVDFDESGAVIAERALIDDPALDGYPRSVAEVFDLIDVVITEFEDGVRIAPPPNECGSHFNAQFDNELGSPTYFDTLGPCDDGVGLRVEVRPIAE